jgi:hypothetical protein
MLDEILEIRELPGFGTRLVALGSAPGSPLPADWFESWNEREAYWTHPRNLEHWITRARNSP